MAAAIDTASAASTPARSRSIADVRILADMQTAHPIWQALELSGALMTSFQSFALLDAWQRHVGAGLGLTPCIVVACDAQLEPVCVIPLCVGSRAGMRIGRFMGGKHVTFNMPIWRKHAGHISQEDIASILDALRAHGIDALELVQQPKIWRGVANPFTALPSQPSVNGCPVMKLERDVAPNKRISRTFRRRLRVKERNLRAMPDYRTVLAESDADINMLLDAFFAVKPRRMLAQNLPNIYHESGVERFIREACLRVRPDGKRAIAIHAIIANNEMISMYAGVADRQRASMIFNTYTLSEYAKFSPGQILLRDIADHYAAEHCDAIDLGVGTEFYKTLFCKDDEPIFDSHVALSAKGAFAAGALNVLARTKRFIKRSRMLNDLSGNFRAMVYR